MKNFIDLLRSINESIPKIPNKMIFSPVTYEERITWLLCTNYKYATEIIDFMEHNPEFLKVGHLISLTEKSVGFDKPEMPKCIFETLIYYIAEAGVNANYGYKQWSIIKDYIREHQDDPLTNLLDNVNIQPKKRQIYTDINVYLNKNNIKHYNLTLNVVIKMQNNIKGIGDGCITFLSEMFDGKVMLPNYSDIGFKKGFQKFYNLKKRPTKKEIFEKTKDWSNIKIGNMMMLQCYHYLKV